MMCIIISENNFTQQIKTFSKIFIEILWRCFWQIALLNFTHSTRSVNEITAVTHMDTMNSVMNEIGSLIESVCGTVGERR